MAVVDLETLGHWPTGSLAALTSWPAGCVQIGYAWTPKFWLTALRHISTERLLVPRNVNPVRIVRNLCMFIDADHVMRLHVTHVVAQCFAVLRHLRLISRLLSPTTLKTVVVALVLSRLDYANSVLTGLPTYLVKRSQPVLNTSAHLIYGLRRFDLVSEALIPLHWLHIPERIQFNLAVLVHRVLHSNAPEYLGPFTPLSDVPSRSHSLLYHPTIFSSRKFVARLLVLTFCQFFIIVLKIICSLIRIQVLFNNCTNYIRQR